MSERIKLWAKASTEKVVFTLNLNPSSIIIAKKKSCLYPSLCLKFHSSLCEHTLHLAAQFLKGLCGGLVIVRELLPGGEGVGAGAVRQAALRGALVPGTLLLPVQVMLYHELKLWGQMGNEGGDSMKSTSKEYCRLSIFNELAI